MPGLVAGLVALEDIEYGPDPTLFRASTRK